MSYTRELLMPVKALAEEAGRAIMNFYVTGTADTYIKDDQSPVTDADLAAHEMIISGLKRLSDFPIVSEENKEHPDIQSTPFWLVDPLDGTKEFIKQSGEFTVNIALIENTLPTLGVIHAPVHNTTWAAAGRQTLYFDDNHQGQNFSTRDYDHKGLTIITSHSIIPQGKTHRFVEKACQIQDWQGIGSSLKFCMVSVGQADFYPRFGRTMEWDTAAGHAILTAAGGSLWDLDGNPLVYGKKFYENHGFMALGQPYFPFERDILRAFMAEEK